VVPSFPGFDMTCYVCVALTPVCLFLLYKTVSFIRTFLFPVGSGIVPPSFKADTPVWAVVTGCTSGIGEGFVFELASRGFNVLMLSRSLDKLKTTSAAVLKAYPSISIEFASVDFSKPDFLTSVRNAIGSKDVAVLINNVGSNVSYPKLFSDHSVSEIEEIISVNVRATTLLTHSLLPKFLARSTPNKGCIINISSLFGSIGSPMLAPYSASKSYIDAFSLSLAGEVEPQGLRVFCCTPGYVVSNMSKLRTQSMTVLTGRDCAMSALEEAGIWGRFVAAPHWTHSMIYAGLMMLPEQFRLNRILSFHRDINKRALAKLAKSQ